MALPILTSANITSPLGKGRMGFTEQSILGPHSILEKMIYFSRLIPPWSS